MPASIVLVGLDGDPDLDRLDRGLVHGGFALRRFADAVGAADAIRRMRPDLLIVDSAGLGFDVCRALLAPSGEPLAPLLVLTAADDAVSRVVAFELGADDAVSRPWSVRELVLRVRAILRGRGAGPVVGVTSLGGLVIDEAKAHVTVDGRSLPLSAIEARLLGQLAARRGAMASREELTSALWGAPPKDPRALDTAVKRLRRKLADSGVAVQTVRGAGFRLELGAGA